MKTIKFIFTILIPCFFVTAQQNLQTNQYILGGLTLSGNHNIQTSSILSIMNLSIGQKVNLPGTEISDGLSQLWDQNLFSDIQIYQNKVENNTIFLDVYLEAFSTLSKFKFSGIKKSEEDKLREELKLTIGMAVSNNILKTSKNKVEQYFIEKGFLYTQCQIEPLADSTKSNRVILDFIIKKNERLKIKTISFSGNSNVPNKKLKKLMKETKETGIKYLFSSSKMIKENYKEDLGAIIDYYHQKGYRDALISGDSLYMNEDGLLMLDISIHEGEQYFFGDISWIGWHFII
jgi:outer membrane protein insertion porin family